MMPLTSKVCLCSFHMIVENLGVIFSICAKVWRTRIVEIHQLCNAIHHEDLKQLRHSFRDFDWVVTLVGMCDYEICSAQIRTCFLSYSEKHYETNPKHFVSESMLQLQRYVYRRFRSVNVFHKRKKKRPEV